MIHVSPLNHSNLICAHGWNGEYRIFERNFNSCTRFQRMILHLLSLEITTTSYWTRTSALGKLPHLPKKEMFNFMRKWWCGFCIISNQEQIQRYRVIHGKVWYIKTNIWWILKSVVTFIVFPTLNTFCRNNFLWPQK